MSGRDFPVLVFPKPVSADQQEQGRGGKPDDAPTYARQVKRLMPQFAELLEAIENRRITLQDTTTGITPEMVLVIEVIGRVENFINAVRNIEGLEWLGEYELEHVEHDDWFEDPNHSDKELKGRLFLTMTNQRALIQIKNLFDKWNWDNNKKLKIPRGLAPLKELFKFLHKIRSWDVNDRIQDTGLLEDWQDRINDGQEIVPIEVELWYSNNQSTRNERVQKVRQIIEELSGQVVRECHIADIGYHAVLGRISIKNISKLLDDHDTRRQINLFKSDSIMFLRPVGQCVVGIPVKESEKISYDRSNLQLDVNKPPIVALLDGMPLAQHDLLEGYLVIDDPDDFESKYQSNERFHGTAMASLICHGDLNDEGEALRRPIYVRPILAPDRGFDGQFHEVIPDEILPVDLVHRSIIRIFEGDKGEPPASPDIRVVSLSVCDQSYPFVRQMSAWARLLDWLSWKYNILFIVSAGNHNRDISLPISSDRLRELDQGRVQNLVVNALKEDTRHRRVLSPAETLNGLTVGAAHLDVSNPVPNQFIDPLITGMPSFTSSHGPGYRRAIKPEIHMSGGKQLLRVKPDYSSDNVCLSLHQREQLTGQRVATSGPTSGDLTRTTQTAGTSNATALTTRQACFFHDLLQEIRYQDGSAITSEYDAVLIKTLLVHGARWGKTYKSFERIFSENHSTSEIKEQVARFFGYGQPDYSRIKSGSDQRVTIIGCGKLLNNQALEFTLPLPSSQLGVNVKRQLTITTAWFSEIKSHNLKYRVAHLWHSIHGGNFVAKRIEVSNPSSKRGTVQHEVFDGNSIISNLDGSEIIIKVNCRKDAGDIRKPAHFGLAVTLEILEEGELFPTQIYNDIRNLISNRVQAKVDHDGSFLHNEDSVI
ncbi:MAG: S8 family peptidase [Bacteroidetes bacterium]|nr:S8 family peptidase [Bacteroidota bacterium]